MPVYLEVQRRLCLVTVFFVLHNFTYRFHPFIALLSVYCAPVFASLCLQFTSSLACKVITSSFICFLSHCGCLSLYQFRLLVFISVSEAHTATVFRMCN
jgi:hypothetical protein